MYYITLVTESEDDKDAMLAALESASEDGEIAEPFDTRVEYYPQDGVPA